MLCQECILCPILVATYPLLATLRRADTNGSNKQRQTVDIQLFNSQWELSQICAKARTTLNILFFTSTAESRAKFLKVVLGRVSKFGFMKQSVTILFFEI